MLAKTLVGPYLDQREAGMAEIHLDGKLVATVDVSSDEDREKGSESIYHDFRLSPGKHTLRVAVLGKPYGVSKGTRVVLRDLVVFRK